jgi:hypothetical protein
VSINDVLFVVITSGIVLTGVYVRAELTWHRRMTAEERRRELAQGELHRQRVRIASRVPIERRNSRRIGFENLPRTGPGYGYEL